MLIENSGSNLFSYFARRSPDPSQSRTFLGQIGEVKLSARIVVRLEPRNGSPPPGYLREASYRTFRSPVWTTGGSKEPFEIISAGPTETTWPLLPGRIATATNRIACYLDRRTRDGNPAGLLPLPRGSLRLEQLPVYVLQKNALGSVLAEGPGLVIFDAISGPGDTIDSPPDTNDIAILHGIEGDVLDAVIERLELGSKDTAGKLEAIRNFFQDEFEYSTWQSSGRPFTTEDTPLTRFLMETKRGHCEYFATATVLLLRRAGVPARYAVGYVVHEASGEGYVVRERDAHSWCLVWKDERWEDFDTTPPSWLDVEGNRRSPMQFLSDAWSRLKFEIARIRWGEAQLRNYLLYSLVPVILFLLYQILFKRRARRQTRTTVAPIVPLNWPGSDSEFYQLERRIAARGVARQPWETLGDWLERATQDPVLKDLHPRLRELLRLHYRHRFDPLGLDNDSRQVLRRETAECLNRDLTRKT